ncbi:MAG: S-layer homology domain-containing protein [Butyricicoccus sp.]|nr:S-layer homology domain-containing protein [Butyricicoccus sp.]
MKKKALSLFLVLALLCAALTPVGAAGANDRLEAVTAKVKRTLGLDTAAYTDFYGEPSENLLAETWFLEWSGAEGSLSVSADASGKVLSLHRYVSADEPAQTGFAPAFPDGDPAAAQEAAQAFLDRVLTKGERATVEQRGTVRLGTTRYRFGGEILVNGLPAGLTYSIAVDCSDNEILSFSRDDLASKTIGGIPSARAKITADAARQTLRQTLALRLEYVLPEGSTQAVLRYLPESGHDYYVDAATGVLVDLTALAQELEKGNMNGIFGGMTEDSAAEAPSASGSLSKVEQEGANKLKGVLSRERLDKKVRAVAALGLDAYTLSAVDYAVAREADPQSDADSVTATLRYGRQVNGNTWRRNVVADAKTGELLRVYSSAWMPDEPVERTVNAEAAKAAAEAFLTAQSGAQFAKTAVYDSADALAQGGQISHSFTYAQQANGYFFPGNSISVGVDSTDGSISAYEKYFDDAVTFDSADGILSMDAALDAWLETYDVPLAYITVPAALDYSEPDHRPLMDMGVGYLYKLVLGYHLEREDYLLGIDAKTGAPVQPDWAAESEGITYGDIAGHWAQRQIETLARYGVGYAGGSFAPSKGLTQLDLIALLASTEGYLYDGSRADELYELAYDLGLIERGARDDNAVLTRAETVRLILRAVGYAHVAELQGIFRTGFADDSMIPADCYGYAALAQGLGMVTGDSENRFLPNSTATRAQAAVMLYQLMSR